MKTRGPRFSRVLWALALVAALTGCAGVKPVPPEGAADTPGHHHAAGIKLLEAKDHGRAREEFARAKALNPDFAPAYQGLGLVALI